jgi:thiol-disulfide isomerase/thioredoxin
MQPYSPPRISLASALLALCLAYAGCGDVRSGVDASGNGERRPAPDFSYTDLEGNEVTLSSLRGKTVIIDFWATWCPPCVFQPPELNAFWQRHRELDEVRVLGVEVGGASVEEIHDWARENDAVAEYPVLTGADEDLARRFGALGFPALVIVAPDGMIEAVHVGLTTLQDLEQRVAQLGSPASS